MGLFMEMLEFLNNNIYVKFEDTAYQLCTDILIGKNCASFLVDLYMFSYEHGYMQKLLENNIFESPSFSFTKQCIDDLLVLNNPRVAVNEIYPLSLDLKEKTGSPGGASYLNLNLYKSVDGLDSRLLYAKTGHHFSLV